MAAPCSWTVGHIFPGSLMAETRGISCLVMVVVIVVIVVSVAIVVSVVVVMVVALDVIAENNHRENC